MAGLLLVAFAYNSARSSAGWSEAFFWAALLLIVAPIAGRQSHPHVSRAERIGLVTLLGGALYLVKVLRSPLSFAFHDEFPHWRTTNNILQTHHLFHENPYQEVSALFPGLEIVTSALADAGNVSIFTAGLLVIGVARLVVVLALYLLLEHVSESSYVAGVGVSLYAAYPNFVFWSSQFSYESLALPLTTLLIFVASHRVLSPCTGWKLPNLALLLLLGTVVVTHHITSYILVAFLFLLTFLGYIQPWLRRGMIARRQPGGSRRVDAEIAAGDDGRVASEEREQQPVRDYVRFAPVFVLTLIASIGWLFLVARVTLAYIDPHMRRAVQGVVAIFTDTSSSAALFSAAAPELAPPFWERVAAYASIACILLLLPVGLLLVWRYYRANTLALSLAVGAAAYPAAQALRLVSGGSEISNRSLDFLFAPLAFVLALAATRLWADRGHARARSLAIAIWASIIFVGGLVVGTPGWARLPGSYLVGGDTRGIQQQSVAAAEWMPGALGHHNRLIADQTNALLMGSYGNQNPLEGLSWLYFAPRFGPDQQQALRQRTVDYIVIDRRLSTGLPRTGAYFEGGEPGAGRHRQPLDPKLLDKFNDVYGLSRIFDSGDIRIFDARTISGSP